MEGLGATLRRESRAPGLELTHYQQDGLVALVSQSGRQRVSESSPGSGDEYARDLPLKSWYHGSHLVHRRMERPNIEGARKWAGPSISRYHVHWLLPPWLSTWLSNRHAPAPDSPETATLSVESW